MCVEGEHQGGGGEGVTQMKELDVHKLEARHCNAAQPTAHGAKPPNWARHPIEKRRKALASFHPPSLPQLQ